MQITSFLITSIIIVLIPGTGVLYTASTGLFISRKKSISAAIGCTAGIVPHLILSLLFMSFLLHLDTTLFRLIRIPGILYLIYLGIDMMRSAKHTTNIDVFTRQQESVLTRKKTSKEIIIRGILINLLNPKLTLFFFSYLPQYIQSGTDNSMFFGLMYGLIFMGLTLIVFCAYGILAFSVRKFMLHSSRAISIIQVFNGLLFIVFAISMIF